MVACFYPTATGLFIWELLPKEYPPFFIFLSTPASAWELSGALVGVPAS